jgi:hypothetical protein
MVREGVVVTFFLFSDGARRRGRATASIEGIPFTISDHCLLYLDLFLPIMASLDYYKVHEERND